MIQNTELEGVYLITPFYAEDYRGTNTESYNLKEYKNLGVKNDFVVDSISTSRKNVLRGIHGDDCTTKLISCLFGTIYFVVLNCDEESKQYGQWQSFTLSHTNHQQILVPPKFGNAHLVLSDYAVFSYKLDCYYDRSKQFTVKYNDPRFDIFWPIKHPILSERDS